MSFIHGRHPELLTEAPEAIAALLEGGEGDGSVQRAAFVALAQAAPERALAFTLQRQGEFVTLPTSLQLAMVELMQRHPRAAAGLDSCLLELLGSGFAPVVRLEAGSALLRLTPHPPLSLLRQLAGSLVDICRAESDSGAKLLILSRLQELQATPNAGVQLDELAVDVLRLLGSSDLEVKRRVLNICLAGLSNRVVMEVTAQLVAAYRQALATSQQGEGQGEGEELHTLLLNTMRRVIMVTSPKGKPVPTMLPALLEGCVQATTPRLVIRVARCLKEAIEQLEPAGRNAALQQVLASLGCFAHPQAAQALLWMVAEWAPEPALALARVLQLLGPLPLNKQATEEEATNAQSQQKTIVLPDGTYQATAAPLKPQEDSHSLRHALLNGKMGAVGPLAASVGACLVKLVLRGKLPQVERVQAMLAITSLLRALPPNAMDRDSVDRLVGALKVLAGEHQPGAWLQACHEAFVRLLAAEQEAGKRLVAPTEPIRFRQLQQRDGEAAPTPLADDLPLALAGNNQAGTSANGGNDGLAKVVQLTGHSDPIYAESIVTVNHGNVLLDMLLVNQTAQAILNMSVDLTAAGELQVVERPPPVSLPAHGFAILKASIRVRATDCGTIGGCLSWGTVNPQTVILTPFTLDILDYLEAPPSTATASTSTSHLDGQHGCHTDHEFRQEWTLLEWENRIVLGPLGTPTSNLAAMFEAMLVACRLRCLTPQLGLSEGGDFLAANVVGRSLFGEEILGNVCLERDAAEGVQGVARLRSQSAGLIKSMGLKLSEVVSKL